MQSKSIKLKLQKLKENIKYIALKIKVVRQILYIHSSVVEFCIGDLRSVFTMENYYLYIIK